MRAGSWLPFVMRCDDNLLAGHLVAGFFDRSVCQSPQTRLSSVQPNLVAPPVNQRNVNMTQDFNMCVGGGRHSQSLEHTYQCHSAYAQSTSERDRHHHHNSCWPFWIQKVLRYIQGWGRYWGRFVSGTPSWWCLWANRTYPPPRTCPPSCPTRTDLRSPAMKQRVTLDLPCAGTVCSNEKN